MNRRLLVCAYAFSPTLGSEFAQGWNYIWNMHPKYDITVLVGSSDGRMGDFDLLAHPDVADFAGRVDVVAVQPDLICRVIKWFDVRIGLSWLFVWGLRRWHWLAFKKAREIHREKNFAAVHQLGPVGFRNPGYMHRLGIPSYWGPVGGFQYIRLRLAFRSSIKYGAVSLLRNIMTYVAARSGYVKSAVRGFDTMSFATQTNRDNFHSLYNVDGPVLSDQATTKETDAFADKAPSPPLQAVWCGSMDARKNIGLLLDIAVRLQNMRSAVQLVAIGSGGMLEAAKDRVTQEKLENIMFTGQIPREEVMAAFTKAHILCFTSLSEANTSTFFEALEAGCVPVALDLDGFSSNIREGIGYKIDPDQDYEAIVEDYASCLHKLSSDAALLGRHSEQIRKAMPDYSWQSLAARHSQLLEDVMASSRLEYRQT